MITEEEVKHIAKLARLGITKEEEKMFQKDLSSILDYFKFLKRLDTSSVKPTFHPNEYFSSLAAGEGMRETREDNPIIEPVKKRDKLREAFPKKEKGYLKVKSIL